MEKEEIHSHVENLSWEKTKFSKKAIKFFKNKDPSPEIFPILHDSYYGHDQNRKDGISEKYLLALYLMFQSNEAILLPYLYESFKKGSKFDLKTQNMGLQCLVNISAEFTPIENTTFEHSTAPYSNPGDKTWVLDIEDVFDQLMIIMKANGQIDAVNALEILVRINRHPEYVIPDLPQGDVLRIDSLVKQFGKANQISKVIKFKEVMGRTRNEVINDVFKALTLKKKGELNTALEMITKIISLDPYSSVWQYIKAEIVLDLDSSDENIKNVEKIVSHAYRVSGYHKTHNYYTLLARLYRFQGNLEEAKKLLTVPITVTVPRFNHTPEELWDYVSRQFKTEKMKIKKQIIDETHKKRGITAKPKATLSTVNVSSPNQKNIIKPNESSLSNTQRFIKLKNALQMTAKIPFSVLTKSLSFNSVENLSSWLFEAGIPNLSLDFESNMMVVGEKEKTIERLVYLIENKTS